VEPAVRSALRGFICHSFPVIVYSAAPFVFALTFFFIILLFFYSRRDTHFAEVVALVERHLAPRAPGGAPPRLVLWAHNSHLGDASFTDMGRARGEVNVGQLLRERLGRGRVVNLGFTTHAGSVAAADTWDAPCTRKAVRRALPGSYEALFHAAGLPEFALDLRRGPPALVAALRGPLLERAIGVIYRPQTERQSHYFRAELPAQFDYVAHIDRTQVRGRRLARPVGLSMRRCVSTGHPTHRPRAAHRPLLNENAGGAPARARARLVAP
jgi:hypothetical protein